MIRHLTISLPVSDLDRARGFFAALGLSFYPKFTGINTACLVLNQQVSVMLMTRPLFEEFAHKPVGNPMVATQHLLAVYLDTRGAVDEFHRRALEAGATSAGEADDHGFMYQQAFHDPDGHPWAITWMDASQMPSAQV